MVEQEYSAAETILIRKLTVIYDQYDVMCKDRDEWKALAGRLKHLVKELNNKAMTLCSFRDWE